MEKKKWWKSKRVWGILTCLIAKVLPSIVPETAGAAEHIGEVGTLLFGVGCLDAKKPVGL